MARKDPSWIIVETTAICMNEWLHTYMWDERMGNEPYIRKHDVFRKDTNFVVTYFRRSDWSEYVIA